MQRLGPQSWVEAFLRKDEPSQWYSLPYVHFSLFVGFGFFSIGCIWAVEQIFVDHKNEIMCFFHLLWVRHLLGTMFSVI